MSSINKQALRNAALHAKITSDWGCEADNFHDLATPDAVLSLLDELEAAEKRIAELEAREVVLPPRYSMLHRDNFDDPYHTEFVYKQHQVLESLEAAGIITKVGE